MDPTAGWHPSSIEFWQDHPNPKQQDGAGGVLAPAPFAEATEGRRTRHWRFQGRANGNVKKTNLTLQKKVIFSSLNPLMILRTIPVQAKKATKSPSLCVETWAFVAFKTCLLL
ncbi:hypothetical protein [Desulfosarcina ovata]|uniref:Uncharacterized protein n=1 Tax=Desulfosarcina ovata subsp. ovata TaxID=2752305 RepID=A0A5K8AA07_9BACT|nr:hypothetical protein [Desulfosarcina ovata]BBO89533.1 hypothetical protein DSCOOX_27130 [Desulfosarcina ovata subsp. ovata]